MRPRRWSGRSRKPRPNRPQPMKLPAPALACSRARSSRVGAATGAAPDAARASLRPAARAHDRRTLGPSGHADLGTLAARHTPADRGPDCRRPPEAATATQRSKRELFRVGAPPAKKSPAVGRGLRWSAREVVQLGEAFAGAVAGAGAAGAPEGCIPAGASPAGPAPSAEGAASSTEADGKREPFSAG